MEKNSIKCPHCGQEVDISNALYSELEQKMQKKYALEVKKHREDYKKAKDELKKQELQIQKKHDEFEKSLHVRLKEELTKERQRLEIDVKKEIQNEQSLLIFKLKEQIEQKSEQLKDLNATKIEIEKLKRQKDEAEQIATLKAQQNLSEQLKEEKAKLTKLFQDENEMKLKQKDEQLNQIKRQLDEAKRKTEQGSMQTQGEAGELVIEEWLKLNYPLDEIEDIKKGQRGADCLQRVNTREMTNCGTIYYESKITKDFKPQWIEKFKSDMIEKAVDVGVLVTATMPKDMQNMGLLDGVWVCSFKEFRGLSAVIRENIINLAYALKSEENRSDKMSLLYGYLTSNEFSMQIESIVDGFTQMQSDLEAEKRAMARIWKQREKQISKVIENTTGMYGSIKGIAGNAVANVKSLELPYEQ